MRCNGEPTIAALARAGLVGISVPRAQGGAGGRLCDAVESIIELAERSTTAAMRLWAHETLVDCLRQSGNVGLRDYHLPSLLEGSIAGTALLWPQISSLYGNASPAAMAHDTGRGWRLQGRLPPAHNLQRDWYVAAVPVAFAGSPTYSVVLLTSEHDGVRRVNGGAALLDQEGEATVTLEFDRVLFREDELIASDGPALVELLRPAALVLRCGVLVGRMRAQLRNGTLPAAHTQRLDWLSSDLLDGFRDGRLVTHPQQLMVLHRQLESLPMTVHHG